MVKKSNNIVGIITMIFLFGMISFVTNLAAPIGNIWKMQPQIAGSNALGMMGNMMNFLAYLFMGIPAGNMIKRYGYKPRPWWVLRSVYRSVRSASPELHPSQATSSSICSEPSSAASRFASSTRL